jgi:hypothetical protein
MRLLRAEVRHIILDDSRKDFDKLDAKLKQENAAMGKLQSNVAETKEASKRLTESIDSLEDATRKREEEEG